MLHSFAATSALQACSGRGTGPRRWRRSCTCPHMSVEKRKGYEATWNHDEPSFPQAHQQAGRAAKAVAQRRLAVLDLKRATAIGVVMQRMRSVRTRRTRWNMSSPMSRPGRCAV